MYHGNRPPRGSASAHPVGPRSAPRAAATTAERRARCRAQGQAFDRHVRDALTPLFTTTPMAGLEDVRMPVSDFLRLRPMSVRKVGEALGAAALSPAADRVTFASAGERIGAWFRSIFGAPVGSARDAHRRERQEDFEADCAVDEALADPTDAQKLHAALKEIDEQIAARQVQRDVLARDLAVLEARNGLALVR